MTKKRDYQVGFGKPPVETQFPKGKSGNLKGRPTKSETLSATVNDIFFNRSVSALENGRRRKVTTVRALLLQLRNDALQGDAAARREVFRLIAMVSPVTVAEVFTQDELREMAAKDEEAERIRAKYSKMFVSMMEYTARARYAGLLQFDADGDHQLSVVGEAVSEFFDRFEKRSPQEDEAALAAVNAAMRTALAELRASILPPWT